ncbi:MAG TPA: hypothetical protein VK013_09340 [Myxococcaceae bacterium]|nr:hypothetical protein [Myxococcaceae bacterium]
MTSEQLPGTSPNAAPTQGPPPWATRTLRLVTASCPVTAAHVVEGWTTRPLRARGRAVEVVCFEEAGDRARPARAVAPCPRSGFFEV